MTSATLISLQERRQSQHSDAAKLPHRLAAAMHTSLAVDHSGNLKVSSDSGRGAHHRIEAIQPGFPHIAINVDLLFIIHLVTSLENVHHPRMSHTAQDPKKEIHQHTINPMPAEPEGQASDTAAALRTAIPRISTHDLRPPKG